MILPANNFVGNSDGENLLWQKFKAYLPNDYISFHNYTISTREPDVILLVPYKGILIIENKSHRAKSIINVPDNKTIRVHDGPPISSPFIQGNTYRNLLVNSYLNPNGINTIYTVTAVAYPYICEQDFYVKNLDKICIREIVFLKEDLSDREAFLNRINTIFDLYYKNLSNPSLIKNGFTPQLMNTVGNLISPNFRNDKEEPQSGNYTPIIRDEYLSYPENYSRVIYSSAGEVFTDTTIRSLISQWLSGTKLQLYTNNGIVYQKLVDAFRSQLVTDNNSADSFFRLEIGKASGYHQSFEIINGEMTAQQNSHLEWLDKNSEFNYGQYQIEHAPEKNMIVKAGAGTGKTYSLISRINYLLWKNNIQRNELKSFLALITFTNKSADEMKEKLLNNFLDYYRLTKKNTGTIYLDFLEIVQDMHIATIDSLAKAILSSYSIKLGLGKEFSITTGEYKKRELLRQNLNLFFSQHPEEQENVSIRMYYLEKRLGELLDKFNSKNVDIAHEIDTLNFGSGDHALPEGIIKVLHDTQLQLHEEARKNNSLCLGEIIEELKYLLTLLTPDDIKAEQKIKYLFIDEFQDTDDVQIDLVKAFQKLIGFKYFVVGDVKQSIYRFRGAEENAFSKLEENTEKPITISLRKNYRTDRKLLAELNTVFTRWNDTGDLNYPHDEVLEGTRNYKDPVPLHILKIPGNEGLQEEEFVDTIKNILLSLAGTAEQAAILVRYNWQVAEILRICNNNQIPIRTEVGGDLFAIDPTIDLQKLLLALKYNKEPQYLYNLYTTSFVREPLPKAALIEQSENELIDYFYQNPPIRNWDNYLLDLRKEPILKVIQNIINDTCPWQIFSEKVSSGIIRLENNELQISQDEQYYMRNLALLLENIMHSSSTEYLTLNRLVEYLEIMVLTRQEETAREQFRVNSSDEHLLCTTVHKAKGLEFHTVILPFCRFDISYSRSKGNVDVIYNNNEIGYSINGDSKNAVYYNDYYQQYLKEETTCRIREETRILYVAMTRAKQSLYCFTNEKPKAKLTWSQRILGV